MINSKIKNLLSAKKWQRFWSKEWVLKFASLLLATLLWYIVGGEEVVNKNVHVPVEIINLPSDLVISNQFKKEIEVTVSGPRTAIQEMTDSAVSRQVNLSKAGPGTNVIENESSSISVPRGVTVVRVQPSSIILSIDKLVQKEFQVTPFTSGDVAPGFEVKKVVMSPESITITGPEAVLSLTDQLITEIIDINGLNESKKIQVPLDLDQKIVSLIGQTEVTTEIIVAPKMVERTVEGVRVQAAIGGSRREVTPEFVDVKIRVPVLLLKENKDVTTLFRVVTIDDLIENNYLRVAVEPNRESKLVVQSISITPEFVKLKDRGSATPFNTPETIPKVSEDEKLIQESIKALSDTSDESETRVELESDADTEIGVTISPAKSKKIK